jgi:hypothetical protein
VNEQSFRLVDDRQRCHYCKAGSNRHTTRSLRSVSQTEPKPAQMLSPPLTVCSERCFHHKREAEGFLLRLVGIDTQDCPGSVQLSVEGLAFSLHLSDPGN